MLRQPWISVREITLMAILVALSIALDTLKFLPMPNGGSINGAMLGLVLIALSFSPIKTFLATSIVFGLLSSLLDGYAAYYLFDYFFALSGFFIISFVRHAILKSDALTGSFVLWVTFSGAFLIRLVSHVISGMLFFDVDFSGSLTYNITYLGPSYFLTLVLLAFMMMSQLPRLLLKFAR